jgi:leucyl aminopeptidase
VKIKYTQKITETSTLIIVPFFETEQNVVFNNISITINSFSGKKGTNFVVENKNKTYLFVGLGKSVCYKTTKTAFRTIAAKQQSFFKNEAVLFFDKHITNETVEAAISGLILGTYNLGHFKKEQKVHPLNTANFILNISSENDVKNSVDKGIRIANAQLETFNLVDLPRNKVTPKYLADWATQSGKKYGFDVTIFGIKESKKLGLHAFLAVGKGSENEAQFIIMEYNPKKAKKHIGLVGKGITFDTGGLNIKTAGMVHMKCDMAGAGAVLGAMQLIADLKLPYKVTAIVPASENSVDALSFVPSDVIGSYNGATIEIIDTDAEGRLVLADGLSYLIKNYNPDTVIDLATLTGSSVATLGNECGALFTNDKNLAEKLQQSGDKIGERLWQLPLWDSYKPYIESDIADVKNYSGKPVAGAISAAKFLEYFTNEHASWAHLDIAGVSFIDDEFAKTKHASAFGVHLITNYIENL